jgi:spore coat polysaccharide biosynthesis protein SpsF
VIVAAIVQARLGSTRLPGKVLEDLGGRTVLEHCLDRCARIPGVDVVVAAIPKSKRNDPVARIAARAGAVVSRGSEHDVLDRYATAARAVRASTVIRVTSDCPLIDPTIAGRVLSLFRASGADYACNNMPPLWPHGLDVEVMTAHALTQAAEIATQDYDREHVTPLIRRDETLHRVCLTGPGSGFQTMRWTLDHPEDLHFFRAVFDALGKRAYHVSAAELAGLMLRRPDLAAINSIHNDETRLAAALRPTLSTPPQAFLEAA